MRQKEIYAQSQPFIKSVAEYQPSSHIINASCEMVAVSFIVSILIFLAVADVVNKSLSLWFLIPLLGISAFGLVDIKLASSDDEFLSGCALAASPIIFAIDVWLLI